MFSKILISLKLPDQELVCNFFFYRSTHKKDGNNVARNGAVDAQNVWRWEEEVASEEEVDQGSWNWQRVVQRQF